MPCQLWIKVQVELSHDENYIVEHTFVDYLKQIKHCKLQFQQTLTPDTIYHNSQFNKRMLIHVNQHQTYLLTKVKYFILFFKCLLAISDNSTVAAFLSKKSKDLHQIGFKDYNSVRRNLSADYIQ